MRKRYLPLTTLFIMFALLIIAMPAHAQVEHGYGVEGHVFSSATLKPLPGARVELWVFFPAEIGQPAALGTDTDAGGFYRFEFSPLAVDDDGKDEAIGYAFAYNCNGVVQIVSLYTKLHTDRVYQRNVYLNVPSSVTNCN